METNNPDFSKEEFLKQTKRIIDSMQDEEANKEFQSIMKDSNFSEEDFRKTILEFGKNEEIKESSFEEDLIRGISIIDCKTENKPLTSDEIRELLNQKNSSIYIDTIHLLVITHIRGLELPIRFFQVLLTTKSMKSKIEEFLLSKDTSNHKLAFAIISGDEELTDEYSKLFANEMVESNFEYNKRYRNYKFIESLIYSVYHYPTTEFCNWGMFRIERGRFNMSLDNSPHKHKAFVSIYSNNKFLISHYEFEKEELTETLTNWFINFFKSYAE